MTEFSIIIPVYNEAQRLPIFLPQLINELQGNNLNGEIIIVDDGSREIDYEQYFNLIQSLGSSYAIKIEKHQQNLGKGAAIKTGFQCAQGLWVGYVDADGATGAGEVVRLLKMVLASQEFNGIFGSRIRMLGYNIDRKTLRHYAGRVFVTLINCLLHIPVYDPQCGCKFFKKADIECFIEKCQETGYLLDIELLAVAYKVGLKFLEVPIHWEDKSGSKVNLLRDGMGMAVGLWRIKKRVQRLNQNKG